MVKSSSSDILKAPWNAKQVRILNKFQKSRLLHPFTCGSGNRTDKHHKDREGILVATSKGWKCPYCLFTQNWALKIMFDEKLYQKMKKHRIEFNKLIHNDKKRTGNNKKVHSTKSKTH